MGRVGEEEGRRDIEQLILGKYLLLVGEYTGRVRKAREFPRAHCLVDIFLWERCAIRVWYL